MSPVMQLTLLCIGCFLAGAAVCQLFNFWLMGGGFGPDDPDTEVMEYGGNL